MKILVTGASGFIGRYVCDATASQPTSSEPLQLILWDRAINGDLHSPGAFETILAAAQPHAVLHLAWTQTGVPGYEHSKENDQWLATTIRIIDACKAADTKFIGIGSCIEKQGNASTRYRKTKLAVFEHAQNVLPHERLTWLRPSWIVSVADHRPRILAELEQSRQRGGVFKPRQPDVAHDFVEIRDVASAIVTAIQGDLVGEQDIASGYLCRVDLLLETVTGDSAIHSKSCEQSWTVSDADIVRLLESSWRPIFTRELLGLPELCIPTQVSLISGANTEEADLQARRCSQRRKKHN